MAELFDLDVTVLGGCGHVGLPLALALSDRGLKTAIYDISETAVERVAAGRDAVSGERRGAGAREADRGRIALLRPPTRP